MQYKSLDIFRYVQSSIASLIAVIFLRCTSDIIPATGERRYVVIPGNRKPSSARKPANKSPPCSVFTGILNWSATSTMSVVGFSQPATCAGREQRSSFKKHRLRSRYSIARSSMRWLFPVGISMSLEECSAILITRMS